VLSSRILVIHTDGGWWSVWVLGWLQFDPGLWTPGGFSGFEIR